MACARIFISSSWPPSSTQNDMTSLSLTPDGNSIATVRNLTVDSGSVQTACIAIGVKVWSKKVVWVFSLI